MLVVAEILGAHGVRGEVRLDARTDVPGRFAKGAVLDLEGVGPVKVVSRRGSAEQPIVRLEGYDSRDAV
ncbi:MAG TPA: ribosome maturation factor RimM, partial [Candidatus Limnocylindria bacterium]|nr:ribosome maturation factor RimM [Candidatus Limnocylindria bacterium]